jgi:hypothetical protein
MYNSSLFSVLLVSKSGSDHMHILILKNKFDKTNFSLKSSWINVVWIIGQLSEDREQTYQGSANEGCNFNWNKTEHQVSNALINLALFILLF